MKRGAILFAALVWPIAGCSESILDAVGLPPQVLTDGLLAHWALDESSGTDVNDSSGNRHDGQLTGGTWIADGRFGGALRLPAFERHRARAGDGDIESAGTDAQDGMETPVGSEDRGKFGQRQTLGHRR